MYYCCKSCDQCCQSCCRCFEECCGGCCDAISECFSTPFSFCTFVSSFVTVGPFILMIIAVIQGSGYNCNQPIKAHLIVQAICNLLNFCFCVYLMCQYGRSYAGQNGQSRFPNESQDTNIMQRTVNLILYDFVVCIYIILLIFFIVWNIVGSTWINNEPANSVCYTMNNGIIIVADQVNIITMWVFLIVGFIIFCYLLMVYSCEEGSCTSRDLTRCCLLVSSCGMCDIGKKHMDRNTRTYANNNRQNYKDSRNGWINSSKRICGCFSLDRRPMNQNGNNQNIQNMNQNQQMQNYNQAPQNHYAVQQQPQQPQQQPAQQQVVVAITGVVDKISNLLKPSPPPPPPPQQQQFNYPAQNPPQQIQQPQNNQNYPQQQYAQQPPQYGQHQQNQNQNQQQMPHQQQQGQWGK